MKTLFLNPPSFARFDSAGARFAATRKTHSLWYPVWLGYATALVPQSKLIDCPAANLSLQELLKQIRKYHLIVIYTSTQSITNDLKVAEAIKEKHSQAKIIFVGPHVSVLAEETLKASRAVDAIARKEFEDTILEITQNRPWSKIKGLTYKKGKKITRTPDRPLRLDLNRLPFVAKIYKRDLPLESYHLPFCLHPYLAIYAGRGCPNQCTFCLWPQTFTGRAYRHRTVANVIAEVKWIQKNLPQIKEIFFDDDTFTVNQPWVEEFCQAIKPLKITWSINARADLKYPLLVKMKAAGCRFLIVGYESGNPQILKNIKKGVTVNQMKSFTQAAHKAGLMIHGTFVLGLPGETLKTIKKTFRFARELNPETIQVSIATPLPGTDFYRYCQNHRFLKEKPIVNQAGYQAPIVSYPHLSANQIHRQVENFHLRFYFRPAYLLKTLKKALSSPAEAKRITLSGWEYGKYLLSQSTR